MYIHLALIKQGGNTDTRMCTYIMSLAEDIEVAVSVHRGGPPLELLRCPIERGPVSDFFPHAALSISSFLQGGRALSPPPAAPPAGTPHHRLAADAFSPLSFAFRRVPALALRRAQRGHCPFRDYDLNIAP